MRLVLVLTLATSLAACGTIRDSRINPFNWFGGAQSQPTTISQVELVADGRVPVDQLTRMELKQMPGGAILSVAGLPPTQGWWNAELIALDPDEVPVDGVLTYRFVVDKPNQLTRQSTPQSRELTAGRFLSDQTLAGVNRVVVVAARNSMTSSR
ncbi:hypothetical protein GVY41_07405 [Frigidibacter albus]|uniref:Lipoprotein n=1 Tax=Frigidibacter albus TaxID=1465486 RepID=A0A6L8VIF9_9RHOB|nr:hypothetical protein [Frigidibacter albus]MZQ89119.1 hypothetical protein [Frigidibacter albus]NBE30824.1 hypothetical protein [Frigidibacter albus]GGH51310.1 hypothetical protein GCM10011341_14870 [Frigidibacter albus]